MYKEGMDRAYRRTPSPPAFQKERVKRGISTAATAAVTAITTKTTDADKQ